MVNFDQNTKEINGIEEPSSITKSKGKMLDSSDDEKEGDGEIRVGREYQAVPPPYIPPSERKEDLADERALLVWAPQDNADDAVIDQFVMTAKEKYGYNIEQALGMLFWHKYDAEAAMADLANYTPFVQNWYLEEMVMFEQAFQYHGKSFHRIRQMLPDKSIADLVKYYYSWKKTRNRISRMDMQTRHLAKVREEGLYGEDNYPEFSDEKEEDKNDDVVPSKKPKGLEVNKKDIITFATGGGDEMMDKLEEELVNYKRVVQNNKQLISALRRKNRELDVTSLRAEQPKDAISARWTDQELQLGVEGIRRHGKDFTAIADIIGTKTVQHVETFYDTYKAKFDLEIIANEEK